MVTLEIQISNLRSGNSFKLKIVLIQVLHIVILQIGINTRKLFQPSQKQKHIYNFLSDKNSVEEMTTNI